MLSTVSNTNNLLYSKNIGGEKTLENCGISPSFFTNFHNFHNIPYANGLQFTIPPNFLQSLFAKDFYCQSFLLYGTLRRI